MDRVLRVLAVVQDAVRHMVHDAAVLQIDLLKPDLFLRRVQHLQVDHQHGRTLLTAAFPSKKQAILFDIGKYPPKISPIEYQHLNFADPVPFQVLCMALTPSGLFRSVLLPDPLSDCQRAQRN